MKLCRIGGAITTLKPGSVAAQRVKETLIEKGMWSQYLEVSIDPDAEVFTKGQPLSSVGHSDLIGLHPISNYFPMVCRFIFNAHSHCLHPSSGIIINRGQLNWKNI